MTKHPTLTDQISGLKEDQISKIILNLADLQHKYKDGIHLVATPSDLFTDALAVINIQGAEILKWKEKYEDLREAFNQRLEQDEFKH
jgi:hypothetical protein